MHFYFCSYGRTCFSTVLLMLMAIFCFMPGFSTADESQNAQSDVTMVKPGAWSVYSQVTNVTQWHPSFTSPYQGANSLNPENDNNETTDATLFAGLRISSNGELWANIEVDQGFGLSNTFGVAGFPSGEAYKVGANTPYVRLPRLFYRQVINLGGDAQPVESDINQMVGTRSANNLIATLGKFSVVDIFDTNTYAHDPRSDFLNWAIIESGAFDYAADAWAYTYGAAIEWTQSSWTLRYGLFDLSKYPNSTTLDPNFVGLEQNESVAELEKRYQFGGRSGKIKFLAYINRGKMGSYGDAIRLAELTNSTPETALVRHQTSQSGFGFNLEQELATNLGVFARASMNQGRNETFDFTDINRSVSGGLSLRGGSWGRSDDTFGIAFVVNGLSSAARNYFADGGLSAIIGDGKLPHYGFETIMETYYSLHAMKYLVLSLDYQYITNPAYNEDRGPVSVFGLRIHSEF